LELVSSVTSIEIPTDKISYDKKSNVFSAEVLNFMFVGIYKKSTRINKILDDIFASLGEIQLTRNELCFIDPVLGNKIPETTKLKHLKIAKKYKLEKEKKTVADKRKSMKRMEEERYKIEEEADEMEKEAIDEDKTSFSLIADDAEYGEEKYKEEPKEDMLYSTDEEREITRDKEAVKAKKKPSSMPRPSPAAGPPAPRSAMAPPPPPVEELRAPPAPRAAPTSSEPIKSISEESKPIVYNINMGLQYYSVMMEKRSYLFYVYFSHKELKIVDEEGKTIYETTITIVTKKEEPPVLVTIVIVGS